MRFLAILLLVTLLCFSAEALRKRQIQQSHDGYCPMHMMHCNVYCRRVPLDSVTSRPIDGCTRDDECASDEKCCAPACGCTNKCTKALDKPGFEKLG